jgi:hypothetical protein
VTLILTCVTDAYVLQISDMRLTYPGGGVWDENVSKAVVFGDAAIFGYTGLACVGNEATDQWLARVAQRATSISNLTQLLKGRGPEAVRRDPTQPLIFVGAGWDREGGRPALVVVGNVPAPHRWDPNPDGSFKAWVTQLRRPCILDWEGQRPPPQSWSLTQQVVEGLARANRPPADVAQEMLKFLQAMASGNDRVGREALIYCLPRDSVQLQGPPGLAIGIGPPRLDGPTVAYFKPGGTDEVEIVHIPAIVGRGVLVAGAIIRRADIDWPPSRRPCN